LEVGNGYTEIERKTDSSSRGERYYVHALPLAIPALCTSAAGVSFAFAFINGAGPAAAPARLLAEDHRTSLDLALALASTHRVTSQYISHFAAAAF
jgi:hypothetical protein